LQAVALLFLSHTLKLRPLLLTIKPSKDVRAIMVGAAFSLCAFAIPHCDTPPKYCRVSSSILRNFVSYHDILNISH
jgi:hypothetical protein